MVQYIALPAVGFLIGLLIISLGGGGGSLYVGILTAFFNIPPAIAASTSLATTIPTTAVGTFSHWRSGNVNVRLGLIMLAAGVAGSISGSLCSGLLPQSLYNKLTGIILLLLAVQMLVSFLLKRRKSGSGQASGQRKASSVLKAVGFGLLGGIMSGLVGLSGGAPIVGGLMILGCQPLETVGTSVFALLGIAITGFAAHAGLGNIDWKLVGLLAVGTTCGAFVGPPLLKRLDKKLLEKILQPVLLFMIVLMGIMLLVK